MTVGTATTSSRPELALNLRAAVVGGVGAVLLLISPLGLTWLAAKAVPAAHIPAQNLSYADLHHLTSSGMAPTNWVQQNYFSWLGWLLIVLAVLTTAAAALLGRRSLGAVGVVVSALGLVLGLFAAKGVLTWSAFYHQIPNLRAGAYFLVVGFILLLIASALTPQRR